MICTLALIISQNSGSKKMQTIQNPAIRNIFKLPYDTHTNVLQTIAKTERLDAVDSRLFSLNKSYISRTINCSAY